MQIQPYLFFDGRCEEALDFYQKNLGAQVQMMMRYNQSPEPTNMPAAHQDKVMHAAMKIGDSTILASDGHCTGLQQFQGFALTILVQSDAEADRIFGALSQGGKVQMPLTKTFFSPRFGMATDRFGIMWMVYVEKPQ